MKFSIAFTATAMLAAFGIDPGAASGQPDGGGAPAAMAVQPGEWEMTTAIVRMQFPDRRAGETIPVPPPSTTRSCITPEQAASPTLDLAQHSQNADCTLVDNSSGGGRLRISLLCRLPPGAMRVTIDGRYTATTLELDQRMTIDGASGPMEMDARIAGRRIGECRGRRGR